MPGREVIKISICLDLKMRSRASSNLAAVGYSVSVLLFVQGREGSTIESSLIVNHSCETCISLLFRLLEGR